MRKFKRVRRLVTLKQAALCVIVGVPLGIYIWKPALREYNEKRELAEAERFKDLQDQFNERQKGNTEVKQGATSSSST